MIALPGTVAATSAVDVRLRALPSLRRPIRHNARLSFHSGASEVWGKVRLLDRRQLDPGEEGWAQIRLDEPVALVKGDLFVVRDANDTIGGGEVVEAQGRRHRRHDQATIDMLTALQEGSPEQRLLTVLEQRQPIERSALIKRLEMPEEEVLKLLAGLVDGGEVIALGGGPLGDGAALFTKAGFAPSTNGQAPPSPRTIASIPCARRCRKRSCAAALGSRRAFSVRRSSYGCWRTA